MSSNTQKTSTLSPVIQGPTLLSKDDIHLFNEGTHYQLYNKLGAHPMTVDGVDGVYFAVWAPNADHVYLEGDFNGWDQTSHLLHSRDSSGVWEGFVPGVKKGTCYKFKIHSRWMGYRVEKADPYGILHEVSPRTASVVWDLDYQWNDQDWMTNRHRFNGLDSPMSIYEVHLGSWRHVVDENGWRSLSYRELAVELVQYVKEMGFTHVEFLPVMEHPFYASWGYQVSGYFAPTSRFGTPQDFMYLIDQMHAHGIGVILDWVPSHFTTDEHGLGYFDGTHLYEHADPRQGFHPDWGSNIFNYGRNEVRNFLISNALFWLEKYHVDGLRVDAVASMLYLNYSREDGDWIPNDYGGNENLEAISFLRTFNEQVYKRFPDVQTIAEESTAWPMVSRPVYLGGLGFGLKWDMGWMHDTLEYICKDPVHRKFHHNNLTFRLLYAFSENFAMPLSHDEVVHGKGSLINKIPGDGWQQFATMRALLGYMYAQPGKKLLFMGAEFGQRAEWNHNCSLSWADLEHESHRKLQRWMQDLNHLYQDQAALHEHDTNIAGFEWVDCNDTEGSSISLIRYSNAPANEAILVVVNFTPVPRENYRLGVPRGGYWRELLNSDAEDYWGGGLGNAGGCMAEEVPFHGRPFSLNLTLPPLGILFFKHEG